VLTAAVVGRKEEERIVGDQLDSYLVFDAHGPRSSRLPRHPFPSKTVCSLTTTYNLIHRLLIIIISASYSWVQVVDDSSQNRPSTIR
jgi:hypothetical protein